MLKSKSFFGIYVLLLWVCGSIHAEVRLPHLLSEHAVLQRDAPIHIWGWAKPYAHLTIKLQHRLSNTTADDTGQWSVWLKPLPAGGPYTLSIDGDGHIEVRDVLVGDVWIASGQSNMEFSLKGRGTIKLKNSSVEIAQATNSSLRLMRIAHNSSDIPLDDIAGDWTDCTPQTAADFSAVAYFFGREITKKEHVPIGLIEATWGGTPADSWISMDTLGSNAELLPAFAARNVYASGEMERERRVQIAVNAMHDSERGDRQTVLQNLHMTELSRIPSFLYNGMIAPLTPYSIKGWLWYQGENNASPDRAPYYATLFPALIADWRARFAQGDLPFLFVQISSFNSPDTYWSLVRDAQRRALAVQKTAMVVTTDVGQPFNVHPPDKQTVGARLAAAALGMVYGEKIEYESPLYKQTTSEPGSLRVWFTHAAGLHGSSQALAAFEIAGSDHHFVLAQARIDGETVVVSAPGVSTPRYVRYGWDNYVKGALYNSAGLPVSTFTSEVTATY